MLQGAASPQLLLLILLSAWTNSCSLLWCKRTGQKIPFGVVFAQSILVQPALDSFQMFALCGNAALALFLFVDLEFDKAPICVWVVLNMLTLLYFVAAHKFGWRWIWVKLAAFGVVPVSESCTTNSQTCSRCTQHAAVPETMFRKPTSGKQSNTGKHEESCMEEDRSTWTTLESSVQSPSKQPVQIELNCIFEGGGTSIAQLKEDESEPLSPTVSVRKGLKLVEYRNSNFFKSHLAEKKDFEPERGAGSDDDTPTMMDTEQLGQSDLPARNRDYLKFKRDLPLKSASNTAPREAEQRKVTRELFTFVWPLPLLTV